MSGQLWFNMRRIIGLTILITLVWGWNLSVWAVDPKPPEPETQPVILEDEDAEKAIEQHAPVIEVGSTGDFLRKSPLGTAEEEEWYTY